MLITSSFVRNSKTPSDARTINLSCSQRFNSRISGSAMTPTSAAHLSPNDLVIASPGMFSVACQTLRVPSGRPVESRKESTRPPFLIILSYSSYSLPLWSRLNGNPFKTPSYSLAKTALESPTLGQNILLPTINTVTQVDPLKLRSRPLVAKSV